jgi:hypothetical protein
MDTQCVDGLATPRDHIEQRTVSPGRGGGQEGAKWFINEFFLSKKTEGWVRGDDAKEWSDQVRRQKGCSDSAVGVVARRLEQWVATAILYVPLTHQCIVSGRVSTN